MRPRILLVNPPIYDFAAYDFWLKPYGLLRTAGRLCGRADLRLFDYMDRLAGDTSDRPRPRSDAWGRGRFPARVVAAPEPLCGVPRRYRRYGRERSAFRAFLGEQGGFDFVLVQTTMTYWYPGVREVIEDVRRLLPGARIVLGGFYATLYPKHARGLGADLVVEGGDLEPLWEALGVTPAEEGAPPFWAGYDRLDVGVMKLTEGCPFECTYCTAGRMSGSFHVRPLAACLAELDLLQRRGVRHVAFYDDALLCRPEETLLPFLEEAAAGRVGIDFHTPNALHARLLTPVVAEHLVRAGVKTFYLGFESSSGEFQRRTGAKVFSEELADAVDALVSAGGQRQNITAYEILGHPAADLQRLEESMRFANSLGIRIMLSDFSPIPGTPDGDACRQWTDLDEPLNHNKTAFPIRLLGAERVNRFKELCRRLNQSLPR